MQLYTVVVSTENQTQGFLLLCSFVNYNPVSNVYNCYSTLIIISRPHDTKLTIIHPIITTIVSHVIPNDWNGVTSVYQLHWESSQLLHLFPTGKNRHDNRCEHVILVCGQFWHITWTFWMNPTSHQNKDKYDIVL